MYAELGVMVHTNRYEKGADMEVFEKIIEKLEEESDYEPIDYDYGDVACSGEQYFIATDNAIEIVKQAAEEYKNTLHETMIELLSGAWVDSDKVQSALGLDFTECLSLLDFSRTAEWWSIAGKTEEERAREGQKIETRFRLKNNGWIPFKQRKLSEEEKEEMGTDFDYILDCRLPEEDEEILVTYANGTVDVDTFMRDGNECYLDSGNDFITEAVAWRKKPEPYQPKGENNENS